MIKTWADARAGVIQDRFTQIRREDVPHTFAASVAFKLLSCVIMALAGVWIFFGTPARRGE